MNGLVGQTEGTAIVIEKIEDLDRLDFTRAISLFSQTTKSLDGFKAVVAEIKQRMAEGVEFNKVSPDRQGDPFSALLEVLDPEQNTTFHDNFLDVDYDLSKVMFIATANNLNTIPGPLLDRMELIEVSGYITEEKIEIARRHLVPKELEANGFKKNSIKIPKNTLEAIIEDYTRESGVRELEKKIGKIFRKAAWKYATDGYFNKYLYELLISANSTI